MLPLPQTLAAPQTFDVAVHARLQSVILNTIQEQSAAVPSDMHFSMQWQCTPAKASAAMLLRKHMNSICTTCSTG
jgi:hypothetical protein